MTVDLPAPFSPTRPTICPASIARSIPFTACTPPNDLATPASSTMGCGMGVISSGRHSDGSMDDDLFAKLRGDDFVRASQRRKDVLMNMATKWSEEYRFAGERDAAADNHDFDGQQRN